MAGSRHVPVWMHVRSLAGQMTLERLRVDVMIVHEVLLDLVLVCVPQLAPRALVHAHTYSVTGQGRDQHG